jgi:uracil-DNA glycosylase family 4
MKKLEALKALEAEFTAWKNPPLKNNRINPVFGEGDPNTKILFIGEAPGFSENREGRPFVGAAGKLLNEMLESEGLSRSDVYITNVVKDQPPGNRDPEPFEISAYLPYLERQIEIIDPKIIVTLGRHALSTLLPEAGSISRVHGKVFKKGNRYFVALYHPAAALHQGSLRETILNDFKAIPKLLKKVK